MISYFWTHGALVPSDERLVPTKHLQTLMMPYVSVQDCPSHIADMFAPGDSRSAFPVDGLHAIAHVSVLFRTLHPSTPK